MPDDDQLAGSVGDGGQPDLNRPAGVLRPRSILRATPGERAAAAVVCAACLGVLLLASWLRPDSAGHGTHEQLGLPRCGWVVATGRPCPTCGMTTAFAEAADGDLLGSARVQPFGAILAVLTAAAVWASLHQAVLGSRIGRMCEGLLRPRALWGAAALWGASWAYTLLTWSG